MPEFLEHHPGLLFVGATLLPLASFLLIILAFGFKTFFRTSPEGSTGETIFKALGGANPSPIPAYIATGAIGLACVLSVMGFVRYVGAHAEHESRELALEEKIEHLRDDLYHGPKDEKTLKAKKDAIKAKVDELAELKGEWAGQLRWAAIGVGEND